ncbi:TauD/TfdA dioxygenase family protein [Novosphingobium sp. JCM 18896]|uniref:TauD/TfdA dioxygenase family protein n=1 Tax=Novosphingobium sp. JCM 18896 TaxID=2989731 RepID=UPI00222350A5|nr:TauD/TfdA family dioxygenase [Novosphingobium sp. JCM 18896]MCW1432268.1 TauD/TfdA family dioxygenase [Novosphingobium sp. JCM 18896]
MSTNAAQENTLRVRPLHDLFGVEVSGVDFSKPIPDATAREILDLADRYFVLLFKGGHLSEPQHVAFTQALGPIIPPVERAFASTSNDMLLRLGNVAMDGSKLPDDSAAANYGDAGEPWHSDGSFKTEPNYLTILHALEIPPERGDTWYASTVAAYEALPDATKARIAGLEMSHPYPSQHKKTADWKAQQFEEVHHPLARPIPGGKTALFLAHPKSNGKISGISSEESDALLAELYEFMTDERFIYKHKWELGDTLLWNNRGVVHSARGWDKARHRRLLQRSETAAARSF